MARRTKRLWTDEEKRSICFQTKAPGVSVAQVARRYGMNANLIFKWLRDPHFAPDPTLTDLADDGPCFLPVEIVDHACEGDEPTVDDADICKCTTGGMIEIDLAGGHHLRINGSYDPEALVRLIRGLS